MMPEAWFETAGQQHLRRFFAAIERAYQEGKERGLRIKRVDANAILRAYRGDTNLTEEDIKRIRQMHSKGDSALEIARHFNIDETTVRNILKEKKVRLIEG